VADITITKGETAAGDRTWMAQTEGARTEGAQPGGAQPGGAQPGGAQRVAVHVVHDLPHLVVESLFGLDDGLWGVLARGGFAAANRAAAAPGSRQHRSRRARLVTDAEFDELAAQNWGGHRVAKAATNAVTNRWQDGPDTPGGVRARLRATGMRDRDKRASLPADEDAREHLRRMSELADRLSDDTIQLAIDEVRRLSRLWQALPPGETLRLSWPYRTPTRG